MFEKKSVQISFTLLRISLGILMLYAGTSKLFAENWSAGGYLEHARTFANFYHWLASPALLPIINVINIWSLTLLGLSLIFGIFVRLSGWMGAALMLFYYFPVLSFPMVGEHAFLIDEHIIYALVLITLSLSAAGRIYGIDGWLIKRFPTLKKIS